MKLNLSSIKYLAALAVAAAALTQPSHASGDSTWNPAAANGNWSEAGNWSVGVPPDGSTGLLTFGASVQTTLTNNISGVSFSGANAFLFNSGASAYTFNGDAITLATPGSSTSFAINNLSTAQQTFNLDIALTGSSGDRYVNTSSGGGDVVFNGNFTGNRRLGVAGSGVVTLAGNNTHSGGVITSGSVTLQLASAAALGSGDLSFAVSSGATIRNTSGAALTFANNLTAAGAGTVTWDLANSLAFTGQVNYTGNRTFTVTSGSVLSVGALTPDNTSRTFTKGGGGTLHITGPAGANLEGNIILRDGGTLIIGHKNSLGNSQILLSTGGSVFQASSDLSGDNAITNNFLHNQNSQNSITFSGENNITLAGTFTKTAAGGDVTSSLAAGKTLVLQGNVVVDGVSLNIAGSGATRISGSIQNGASPGGMRFSNTNTTVLTGANSYTGATEVNAGTLLIDGNTTAATGAVTVTNTGTVLGGSGIIGGNTTLNAGTRLSPGNSAGELTFAQNLTLNGASFVDFEGGDLITVDGSLSLSGTWTLALGGGFVDGGMTAIFSYGSVGTFAGGALDPARINISGLGFTPTDALFFTDTGTAIILNGISVIPEPSTGLFLVGGLALLVGARRRWSVHRS